jgi:rhamnosyltransferase
MNVNKNIIIIGSRGLFKNYGGWEYYLNNLLPKLSTENDLIIYNVINFNDKINSIKITEHNKNLFIHEIPIKRFRNMLIMDLKAFFYSNKLPYKKKILYFLGVRVGIPLYFISIFFKKKNIWVFNPAGLEWLRRKFSFLIRVYLFLSAYLMSISFDYIISDSFNISKFYISKFHVPEHKVVTIPYGVSIVPEFSHNIKLLAQFKLQPNNFYLIISRFVPENSYELILQSFIKSTTNNKLVIVSNFSKEHKFFTKLNKIHKFTLNPNIILIESLYEESILNSLRFFSTAYINGNQLGGTNPGLLQAMVTSKTIIAFNSVFAREVMNENGYFFSNQEELISLLNINRYKSFKEEYVAIIENKYLWEKISKDHKSFFESI